MVSQLCFTVHRHNNCQQNQRNENKPKLTRLGPDLPQQAGAMSPLRDLLGRCFEASPVCSNSQPNLRASCMAVLSRAVWCISFLGMQPTFTHVPPRPDHPHQNTLKRRTKLVQIHNALRVSNRLFYSRSIIPQEVPFGVGTT